MFDAAAAADFDLDREGMEGSSGLQLPRTRKLLSTVLAGRSHSLEPAAAGDAVRQRVVDGTLPCGHWAVGSPQWAQWGQSQGHS